MAGYYYADNINTGLNHSAVYNYDAVNRLSSAGATGNSTYRQTFGYDAYGNMSCSANPAEVDCLAPTYGASSNRIGGYRYDSAGDVTNDGTYTYQWDAEAHLTAVIGGSGQTVSANTYNALGQTASVFDANQTPTTYEAYGPGGELLWRYNASSNMRAFVPLHGGILAEYYYPGSGGVHPDVVGAMTTSPSGTLFDHPDALGSITSSTTYSGGPCQQRLFYPFGELWTGAGSCGMHQTFAHLPDYDAETDQYNTLNRHYTPRGRWISPDPAGKKAVKLDNPQTWNMYAYVRNNPTTLTDPTGLYNTTCKEKDIKNCSTDIQNLDANIQKNLKSKDRSVRAAAAAYGSFNDKNNVNVRFDPNAKVATAPQDRDAQGRPLGSVTVTFKTGMETNDAGVGIVAHEGSHVADFESVMAGAQPMTLKATEVKAYQTQAATLSYGVGSSMGFIHLQSPDVAGLELGLMQPIDATAIQVNTNSIEQFLGAEPSYGTQNLESFPYVNP